MVVRPDTADVATPVIGGMHGFDYEAVTRFIHGLHDCLLPETEGLALALPSSHLTPCARPALPAVLRRSGTQAAPHRQETAHVTILDGTDQPITPETRAASLFVTVFSIAYEHDPLMTIALHMSSGSSLAITGQLDNWRMHFHPAEVSTLLAWLTRAVATEPESIITITTDRDEDDSTACGWAWCLATGAALDCKGAAPYFDDYVELRGAEQRNLTLDSPSADTSAAGLSRTLLTDEVKTIVTAHGEPAQPVTGHQITLRPEGTITVHFTADDVPAARSALAEIEFEDFDVNLRTRHGHLIGHITLEADGADLVSIDGIPADELSSDDTE